MAVVPAGVLSLPLKYLRDTIAASSNFQTWTSTANAAAALARVHYGRAAADATHPLAVVGFSDEFVRESPPEAGIFEMRGMLEILFRNTIVADTSDADAVFACTNAIGAIMKDMEESARTAGYLSITSCSVIDGPSFLRADDDEGQTVAESIEIIVGVEFVGI